MAKSPKLVEAVSKILQKPEETVRVALRRLHEAGLIEVTGRGRGGKHMTPRDAAMLLLAMSTGTTLKDSPLTLQAYWNLALLPDDIHRDRFGLPPGNRIPALKPRYFAKVFTKSVTPVDTLGTVLSRIIELAAQGALFPKPERNDFADIPLEGSQRLSGVPFCHLQLKVHAPSPLASIFVQMNMQWQSALFFGSPPAGDMALGETWLAHMNYLETRQYSEEAISLIGESLH